MRLREIGCVFFAGAGGGVVWLTATVVKKQAPIRESKYFVIVIKLGQWWDLIGITILKFCRRFYNRGNKIVTAALFRLHCKYFQAHYTNHDQKHKEYLGEGNALVKKRDFGNF